MSETAAWYGSIDHWRWAYSRLAAENLELRRKLPAAAAPDPVVPEPEPEPTRQRVARAVHDAQGHVEPDDFHERWYPSAFAIADAVMALYAAAGSPTVIVPSDDEVAVMLPRRVAEVYAGVFRPDSGVAVGTGDFYAVTEACRAALGGTRCEPEGDRG